MKRFIYLIIAGSVALLFLMHLKLTPKSLNSKINFEPAYLKLHKTGELKKIGKELWNMMKNCRLCPRECGIIYRGLMIRHLVMPNNVSGTKEVIKWIAENLPKDTYLNIMAQYTPMYKAFQYPEISRRITRKEYEEAIKWAKEAGLTNLDIQW